MKDMESLKNLKTAATLRTLKEQGLDNVAIVALVKDEGWPAVQSLAEEGGK